MRRDCNFSSMRCSPSSTTGAKREVRGRCERERGREVREQAKEEEEKREIEERERGTYDVVLLVDDVVLVSNENDVTSVDVCGTYTSNQIPFFLLSLFLSLSFLPIFSSWPLSAPLPSTTFPPSSPLLPFPLFFSYHLMRPELQK